MPAFKIRKGRPGEEAALHETHMRSIREVCSRDHTADEVRGWGNRPLGNRWVTPLQIGNVWVVEGSDGSIYGVSHIAFPGEYGNGTPEKATISTLYLTPEILRLGFGRKLLEVLIERARQEKVPVIELGATLTAHGFYKKFGFVDTGPVATANIGGSEVRYIPMELNL